MNFKVFLFFLVFLVPGVFALEFSLPQETYLLHQPVVLELVVDTLVRPLSLEHISVLKNNISVSVGVFLYPLNDSFFLLGLSLDEEGNYTVHVENVLVRKDGRISEDSGEVSFRVQGSSLFSYRPFVFFVDASKPLQTVEVVSYSQQGQTLPLMTQGPFALSKSSLLLPGQGSTSFTFRLTHLTSEGRFFISIGDLEIPVFVSRTPLIIEEPSSLFLFHLENGSVLSSFSTTLEKGKLFEGTLFVTNTGPDDALNVSLSVDGNLDQILTLDPFLYSSFLVNETKPLLLSVNTSFEGVYSGNILLGTQTIPLLVTIVLPELQKEEPFVLPSEGEQNTPEETSSSNESVEVFDFFTPPFQNATATALPPKKTPYFVLSIVLFILLLLGAYYWFRRKTPHEEEFSSYISKLEKKK